MQWPIIFLSFNGIKIGKSIKEDGCEKIIKDIFDISKKHSCIITCPEDVMVGKSIEDKSKIKELNQITNDDLILDIGPKTINKIKISLRTVKQILWNGPAGYFENPNFAIGSYEIAKKIIKKINLNLSILL